MAMVVYIVQVFLPRFDITWPLVTTFAINLLTKEDLLNLISRIIRRIKITPN